jgi:Rps23 Pro-64 3,4-dihydroxylase Tpa1-like proline 4-hydroxylase
VLDDFLEPGLAEALVREFPAIDAMPKSRDYVFSDKRELSSIEEQGQAGAAFHGLVMSEEFRTFLVEATGIDGLFIDPQFFGGGFHQGGDGSYLDLHTDFNLHPMHKNWHRRLNILLYLNPDWKEEYGGQLMIKARPDQDPVSLAPSFNRVIVMETSDRTFHGYKQMTLPAGVTRKSIAAYAYSEIKEGAIRNRTTGWAPEDAGFLKRNFARNYDRLVKVKNRFFGSATAKNR